MLRSLRTMAAGTIPGQDGRHWDSRTVAERSISPHEGSRPMPAQNNEGHQMKRIVLPSGKTIEVVYFESHGVPASPEAPEAPSTASDAPQRHLPVHVPAEDARDLHVCVNCESELVYPVQW